MSIGEFENKQHNRSYTDQRSGYRQHQFGLKRQTAAFAILKQVIQYNKTQSTRDNEHRSGHIEYPISSVVLEAVTKQVESAVIKQ